MSLSEHLRLAALEREREAGYEINNDVLEPADVIDLRKQERQLTPNIGPSVQLRLPIIGDSAGVGNLFGNGLTEPGHIRSGDNATAQITDAGFGEVDETTTIDLTGATLDPMLDPQPTTPCQRCSNVAKRDLIDIFNSIEYYSCDGCCHMLQQKKH